jgi:hypothetical protein
MFIPRTIDRFTLEKDLPPRHIGKRGTFAGNWSDGVPKELGKLAIDICGNCWNATLRLQLCYVTRKTLYIHLPSPWHSTDRPAPDVDYFTRCRSR